MVLSVIFVCNRHIRICVGHLRGLIKPVSRVPEAIGLIESGTSGSGRIIELISLFKKLVSLCVTTGHSLVAITWTLLMLRPVPLEAAADSKFVSRSPGLLYNSFRNTGHLFQKFVKCCGITAYIDQDPS